MSQYSDEQPIELHMFSFHKDHSIAELLVATAHHHRTGCSLKLGDTVSFGRPWVEKSICDRGLVSQPYLDGPSLEWCDINGKRVRFFWLVPVTAAEVAFARASGVNRLEELLEASRFNYLDPNRPSVV
jgi:hypothetical protein